MAKVTITYFSDVLCIWAFAAQIRLDELREQFGEQIAIEHRFISVFGDTRARIGDGWEARGGFAGFADHVQQVAGQFPHIAIDTSLWRAVQPASSGSAHLVLKAAQMHADRDTFEQLLWAVRCAFFVDGRDIGQRDVLVDLIADDTLRLQVEKAVNDGTALAALLSDYDMKAAHGLQGSPTYFLNNRRQILYGNVGYRIIEANVEELLREPADEQLASWC